MTCNYLILNEILGDMVRRLLTGKPRGHLAC